MPEYAKLKDWPPQMVCLACTKCARKGQYLKTSLLKMFDPNETLPELRHLIAQCPERGKPGSACGVYYADLGGGASA